MLSWKHHLEDTMSVWRHSSEGGAYVDIRDEVSSSKSISVADVVPAVCM